MLDQPSSFCDVITGWVHGGRAVDDMFLDVCVLNTRHLTTCPTTFYNEVEIDEWTVRWVKN